MKQEACSRYEEKGNAYKVLVGKLHRKRSFGKPRHRLEGNIKICKGLKRCEVD